MKIQNFDIIQIMIELQIIILFNEGLSWVDSLIF